MLFHSLRRTPLHCEELTTENRRAFSRVGIVCSKRAVHGTIPAVPKTANIETSVTIMAHDGILDREVVRSRLYPGLPEQIFFPIEEELHSWQARYHQIYEQPLLRVWDQYSGSQPISGRGMVSRAPNMHLDTRQTRRSSLAYHLDHKNWDHAGPYISFTTSPAAIEEMVGMRFHKRGPQTVTVIDPKVRISKGLPVLDVEAEMESYKIPDPYGRGNQYYINHHVCLWEVTEPEIVGHWQWDVLKHDQNWYENTVMPAFRRFTETPMRPSPAQQPTTNSAAGALDDLLSNFNNLSVGHHDSDSSETDWENECDNSYSDEDYYSDTVDDLEEAGIADNIIKIIEGDW